MIINKYLESILNERDYYFAYSVGSPILKVPRTGELDYQDIYSRRVSIGGDSFMRHCAVCKIVDAVLWEEENLND